MRESSEAAVITLIELREGILHSTAARVLHQARLHGKAQLYSNLKTKRGKVLKQSQAGQPEM